MFSFSASNNDFSGFDSSRHPFTPGQLSAFYMDGNEEAAFQVFEHGGPSDLRAFLGAERVTDEAWKRLYFEILDSKYSFLRLLSEKYTDYLCTLLRDHGVSVFREVFMIQDSLYDPLVARTLFMLDRDASQAVAYVRSHMDECLKIAVRNGAEALRKHLGLPASDADFAADTDHAALMWRAVLDAMLDAYGSSATKDRRKMHTGRFFSGLRALLRREIEGEI